MAMWAIYAVVAPGFGKVAANTSAECVADTYGRGNSPSAVCQNCAVGTGTGGAIGQQDASDCREYIEAA